MKIEIKSSLKLIKKAFNNWSDDHASSLGAALAYYTVFSMAPLVIILIAIMSFIFGHSTAQAKIIQEVSGLVGAQGADFIKTALQNGSHTSSSIFASIIGFITLLFGALGVFGQLQQSLDTIWKTPKRKQTGFMVALRNNVLSFGMILTIGFLLTVSLVVSAGLNAIGNKIFGGGGLAFLVQIADIILSLIIMGFLFALMYKFLPNEKTFWKSSLVGGILTAVLFALGKLLIGLYLGSSSIASTYGAAASLVVLLLWVYYSAQIFYFGAEFTYVYSRRLSK